MKMKKITIIKSKSCLEQQQQQKSIKISQNFHYNIIINLSCVISNILHVCLYSPNSTQYMYYVS